MSQQLSCMFNLITGSLAPNTPSEFALLGSIASWSIFIQSDSAV